MASSEIHPSTRLDNILMHTVSWVQYIHKLNTCRATGARITENARAEECSLVDDGVLVSQHALQMHR